MGKNKSSGCKGGDDCHKEQHLCKIVKRSGTDQIREIIREARFFCTKCGRSARKSDNLCKPLDL